MLRPDLPAQVHPPEAGEPTTRAPGWLIALRVWAIINLPLVAFAALLGMGSVLAASRHASVGTAMLVLLALTALAVAAPLLVLASRRRRSGGLLYGAMLVMLVTTAIGVQVLWSQGVVPAWKKHRFDQVMDRWSIVAVQAEPLRNGEVAAGWRTRATFRLAQDTVLDDAGEPTLALLRDAVLWPAPGTQVTPFGQREAKVRVERDGKAVDLEALARTVVRKHDGSPADVPAAGGPAILQAGDYVVTFDTWFQGLRADVNSSALCFVGVEPSARQQLATGAARGFAVQLRAHAARANLGILGGRHVRTLAGERIQVTFDHEGWLKTLESLPIERCADLEARRQREAEEAAERQRFADQMQGKGDWRANPLRVALCAHDLAEVKRLLPLAGQAMPLSGAIAECGIDASRPALFDLVFPASYAREHDRAGYCLNLQGFHERRDEAALKRLVDLGLPAMCKNLATYRSMLAGKPGHVRKPAEEPLIWLRRLHAMKLPICETSPAGLNLLQVATPWAEPQLIEFLLDSGCDPAAMPVLTELDIGPPIASPRLAWLLRVRRFLLHRYEDAPPSLPEAVVARISSRMGDVTQEELTRVHPMTGTSGPLLVAAQRGPGWNVREAELISWLARHGARMDAADTVGYSWYRRGYSGHDGKPIKGHEVLDGLSVEQLRQLIKPVNLSTGKPGRPLEAVSDRSPGGLGAYLCQRGAITC